MNNRRTENAWNDTFPGVSSASSNPLCFWSQKKQGWEFGSGSTGLNKWKPPPMKAIQTLPFNKDLASSSEKNIFTPTPKSCPEHHQALLPHRLFFRRCKMEVSEQQTSTSQSSLPEKLVGFLEKAQENAQKICSFLHNTAFSKGWVIMTMMVIRWFDQPFDQWWWNEMLFNWPYLNNRI